MQQGWIKLHRSILENFLWQEERKFSKAEAWLELLLTANYEERKILIAGQSVKVETGQILTTMKYLAQHWGWSSSKVKFFLNLLEVEGMIATKRTSKYTLITILKWGFYQGQEVEKNYQKNIKKISENYQKNTTEELKNNKNINNNNISGDGGGGRTRVHASEEAPSAEELTMSLEVEAAKAADNRPTHSQIIHYGEIPTTENQLQRVQAFTAELFGRYRRKRECVDDVRRVFEYAYHRQELPDGEFVAVFDEQKAALLEYAFEQAAAAGQPNWKYVDGIYRNFEKRGIRSIEDAYAYEWRRNYGTTT